MIRSVPEGQPTAMPSVPTTLAPTVLPRHVDAVVREIDFRPGRLVKNRFELCDELGLGGMGVVYRAKDLRKVEASDPDPYVAIKFLGKELSGSDVGRLALQREAKHSQALNHPNIVKVFDYDRDGSLAFLTMELLDGKSLLQRLRERAEFPFKAGEIEKIVMGVLDG